MKYITLVFVPAFIIFATSCKKTNHGNNPILNHPCRLIEEPSTGGPGYQGDWHYEYDDKNVINKATIYANGQATIGQVTAAGNSVSVVRSPTFFELHSFSGNLQTGLPATMDISITDQPNTYPHFDTYVFSFNSLGQLTYFRNTATSVNVYYDANGNVTKMEGSNFTGPRVLVNTRTVVEGYDNKPSPYAGQPIYKFLEHNFDFAYYDEQQVIAALSYNNPGKITTTYYDATTDRFGDAFIKQMTYTYNSGGMPQSCTVTDISSGTAKSYATHSYVYDGCD